MERLCNFFNTVYVESNGDDFDGNLGKEGEHFKPWKTKQNSEAN